MSQIYQRDFENYYEFVFIYTNEYICFVFCFTYLVLRRSIVTVHHIGYALIYCLDILSWSAVIERISSNIYLSEVFSALWSRLIWLILKIWFKCASSIISLSSIQHLLGQLIRSTKQLHLKLVIWRPFLLRNGIFPTRDSGNMVNHLC